jgi:hypothetical protein
MMRCWSRGAGIAFTSFTIDCSGMVTSPQVLVEDGSITAMKCVLFPIRVAIMVNRASCLGISIMTIRIGHLSAIKASVSVMRCDHDGFDIFRFIRPFLQHHWTFGLVMFWRWTVAIGRRRTIALGWWVVTSRLVVHPVGCRGVVRFRLMIVMMGWMVGLGFMICW